MRPVKGAAALFAAVASTLLLAAPAQAAIRFRDCGDFGFKCARVHVALDRTGTVPGHISLLVKRLRAQHRPSRGATFLLAGGPGQSATDAFEGDGLGGLFPAFARRDLIVFDQRGTGRSGVLRCRALEHSNLLDAGPQAGACASSLGPRRALYTTRDSVEDIETVRRRLGVPRIALVGVSYGTKVALGYALRYPANVERLVLDSVVEPDGPDPLYRDSFAAVPRALRALCRSRCGAFTADPVADLERLVARLASGPLRGRVIDHRGRSRRASLDRSELFLILLAGDFDPTLRAAFPAAVKDAADGDPAALLRLKRRALLVDARPPPAEIVSSALFAATTCEETTFPWARNAAPDPAERRRQAAANAALVPDSAFRPFDRATALDSDILSLCDRWPAAPVAPALGPGPLPDVPVLLLDGEDDLRTPVENARRVAALFAHASVLAVPATGHSVLGASGCADTAMRLFFQDRAVPQRCPRTRREFPPTLPPPASLGRAPRLDGVPGRAGRALSVVALTLRDVSDDAATSLVVDPRNPIFATGGGLRAGHYRLSAGGELTLFGVVLVPGVRVSGRLQHFGEGRQRGMLRVGGDASPHGVLRVRRDRIAGRLGGRRVGGRMSPSVSGASALAARLPEPLRAYGLD
jgi:pimeloyl-ACP methyl ester carboxylesterase